MVDPHHCSWIISAILEVACWKSNMQNFVIAIVIRNILCWVVMIKHMLSNCDSPIFQKRKEACEG